jgi:ELWxxDGT repeat protein
LTNANGTLFFAGNDGTDGSELWKSDGTAAGTVMVKDINPGSFGSSPASLTLSGGHLFFTANDGTHGVELWDPPVWSPAVNAPPVHSTASAPSPAAWLDMSLISVPTLPTLSAAGSQVPAPNRDEAQTFAKTWTGVADQAVARPAELPDPGLPGTVSHQVTSPPGSGTGPETDRCPDQFADAIGLDT